MTLRHRFASLLCLPLLLAACGGEDLTSGDPVNTGGTSGAGGSGGAGGQPGAGAGGSDAGAAGSTTAGSAGASAGSAGAAGDAGAAGATCSASDAVPTDAVFVVPSTLSQPGNPDGSSTSPYTKIADAIGAAAGQGKARVIISAGAYSENIALNALPAALTIEGGWSFESSKWVHVCDPKADTYRPTIKAASNTSPTLRVSGTETQTLTLHSLRIATTDVASAGGSQIAIHVNTSTVIIDDVDVVATSAGDGQPITATLPEAPLLDCNGFGDCSAMDAQNLDGNPGAEGSPASSGTFGPDGFKPASGTKGVSGDTGKNGTAGTKALETNCFVCQQKDKTCDQVPTTNKGTDGKCGCGRTGGGGGEPGGSGGASVALLATSKSTVTITSSALTSGDGGDGAPGQDGGTSGSGSDGSAGTPSAACKREGSGDAAYCSFDGFSQCVAFNVTSSQAPGGATGGKGGKGGKGGSGGPGAGGPSFAVVSIDSGLSIDEASTKLAHGKGGSGAKGTASDAPAGEEGDVKK